jgi:hypothetical protein
MLISRKQLNPPKNEGRTVLSLSDSLYTQSEAFEPLFYPEALNSATNNGFTMEKSPYIYPIPLVVGSSLFHSQSTGKFCMAQFLPPPTPLKRKPAVPSSCH